jgi:hypothetical protein
MGRAAGRDPPAKLENTDALQYMQYKHDNVTVPFDRQPSEIDIFYVD